MSEIVLKAYYKNTSLFLSSPILSDITMKPSNTKEPFFCNDSTLLHIKVLDTRSLPSFTAYYQITLLWFLQHISTVLICSVNPQYR